MRESISSSTASLSVVIVCDLSFLSLTELSLSEVSLFEHLVFVKSDVSDAEGELESRSVEFVTITDDFEEVSDDLTSDVFSLVSDEFV